MTGQELTTKLGELFKSADFSPLFPYINEIAITSVKRNFIEGGRFGSEVWGGGNSTWQQSGRVRKTGGQTLRLTGRLMNSIFAITTQESDGIKIKIYSNLAYAPLHEFGFNSEESVKGFTRKIKSRSTYKSSKKTKKNMVSQGIALVRPFSRKMNIIARPYMVLQTEDIMQIRNLIIEFLQKKFS